MLDNHTKRENLIIKDKPYPRRKVITYFAVYGGAVGGIIISLINALLSLTPYALLLIIYALPFGVILGLIPAVATALTLAKIEQHITNKRDYLTVACIGLVVTLLLAALLPVFFQSWDAFLLSLALASIGAFSAVIVGSWALPRS